MRPSFRRLIIRLGVTGAVTLIAFPVGILTYLHTLSMPSPIALKNLQASIVRASAHDTTINIGPQKFVISGGQLLGWSEPYTRSYNSQGDLRFTNDLNAYILTLAKKTDSEPIEARFTINNGVAAILVPGKNGQHLDVASASTQLRRAILADQADVTLTPDVTPPAITEENITSLGINNLIATGESDFTSSTLSRIKNINVSSSLFNGLIIKPGMDFSFNTILGTVDASTGYVPEKVIKSGKVSYEYGGGICQVSTTMFRAAIMAGFPILERKPHAFPVHYYEPQGFDATIYPGVSDMRFVNDTTGPILVQTRVEGKKLFFEFYGISDGRKVSVDGPHQYDKKPSGAMKAVFTRTITAVDGTYKEDSFYSNYKSPALYPMEKSPYE